MQQLKKKINRTDAIKLAKQYIEKCIQMNLRIHKAILFGSQSTGTSNAGSDIDLLIVSDMFNSNSLNNWKMLAPITAQLFEVEPHPYPYKNYLKGDPFIDEVKKSGIEIKF